MRARGDGSGGGGCSGKERGMLCVCSVARTRHHGRKHKCPVDVQIGKRRFTSQPNGGINSAGERGQGAATRACSPAAPPPSTRPDAPNPEYLELANLFRDLTDEEIRLIGPDKIRSNHLCTTAELFQQLWITQYRVLYGRTKASRDLLN